MYINQYTNSFIKKWIVDYIKLLKRPLKKGFLNDLKKLCYDMYNIAKTLNYKLIRLKSLIKYIKTLKTINIDILKIILKDLYDFMVFIEYKAKLIIINVNMEGLSYFI